MDWSSFERAREELNRLEAAGHTVTRGVVEIDTDGPEATLSVSTAPTDD